MNFLIPVLPMKPIFPFSASIKYSVHGEAFLVLLKEEAESINKFSHHQFVLSWATYFTWVDRFNFFLHTATSRSNAFNRRNSHNSLLSRIRYKEGDSLNARKTSPFSNQFNWNVLNPFRINDLNTATCKLFSLGRLISFHVWFHSDGL
jgi:hypothetical protein